MWRQREVYPAEFADPLYEKLIEMSGIDVGFLQKSKARNIKTSNLRCLSEMKDKKK